MMIMNRISQIRVAACLGLFKPTLEKKYSLTPYKDPKKPAIFFGCYTPQEVDAIINHKSLAVVVWAGSDTMNLYQPFHNSLFKAKHVVHASISKWIYEDLNCRGIPSKRLPICGSDFDLFNPTPLGKSIYVYSNHIRAKFYGEHMLQAVRERFTDCDIIYGYSTPPGHVSVDEMPALYSRCFIGLR